MELKLSEKFEEWIQCFGIQPGPLLHIGAHLVQERHSYSKFGFEPVAWVEAQRDIVEEARVLLEQYPNQRIFQAALWSSSNYEMTFHIAGHEGSSSSLLEPHLITASHPEVWTKQKYQTLSITLDDLIQRESLAEDFRIIVLDVQGAEIEVIKGGTNALQNIDYIITEISSIELYKGTAKIRELSEVLDQLDFSMVASELNRSTGWGEALYMRKSLLTDDFSHSHIVVGKKYPKGRIVRTILLIFGFKRLGRALRKK
jgi:FkbM family methyltransferase